MKRRRFIATASTAIAGATLAGCTGGDGAGDNDTTDTDVADIVDTTTDGDGAADGDETTTNGDGTTTDGEQSIPTEGNVDNPIDGLEVRDLSASRSGDGVVVTGTVENTSQQTFDYVEVEVTLQDGDTLIGEFVDTSDEDTDTLPPGETWQFEAEFDDENLTEDTTFNVEVDAETQ